MRKHFLIVILIVIAGITTGGLITYNQLLGNTNSNYTNEAYLLEILGLKENYDVDEIISFTVHEKGFDIRCFSVYAEIYDSIGNKIWEEPQVEECPPGLGKSGFDHQIPFSGTKIDKAGEYQLVVQSRGKEITRTFSVSGS